LKRKIFCASSFFNELDILELKFEILDPIVDYFIISESELTFNGDPKPLYFELNKKRYEKFHNKIILQTVYDYPNKSGMIPNDVYKGDVYNLIVDRTNQGGWFPHDYLPYLRDTWSKEVLIRPIYNLAKPQDIIILGDVDEIPNPKMLKYIIDNFDAEYVYNLEQKWYNYYFNCLKSELWMGNIILSFENFLKVGMCELKMRRRGFIVQDGGWHFSYCGKKDLILEKLQSGQEHTWNVKSFIDNLDNSINNCFTCGHDLHLWPSSFKLVSLDETYPEYLLKNQEKYSDYIYKEIFP